MSHADLRIDVMAGTACLPRDAAGEIDVARLLNFAIAADQAGVDSLIIEDGEGLEPLMTCSFLAASTRSIRLVASLSPRWHPYNAARRLASIDHVSGGRAGWHLAAGIDPSGRTMTREIERAEVMAGLWSGWAADWLAVGPGGKPIVNPDSVRPLDYRGTNFAVAGPLDIPRAPQGRIPLTKSWNSSADTGAAAMLADRVIFHVTDAAALRIACADLAASLREVGRSVASLQWLVAVDPADAASFDLLRASQVDGASLVLPDLDVPLSELLCRVHEIRAVARPA